MTARKRWRCYDAGRTSRFSRCSLASTPQLPPPARAGHASTKSIPRLPTSLTRSEERTPSMRPSRDAYGALGDEGEEALDQVEPRAVGRHEVQMPARTGRQPGL